VRAQRWFLTSGKEPVAAGRSAACVAFHICSIPKLFRRDDPTASEHWNLWRETDKSLHWLAPSPARVPVWQAGNDCRLRTGSISVLPVTPRWHTTRHHQIEIRRTAVIRNEAEYQEASKRLGRSLTRAPIWILVRARPPRHTPASHHRRLVRNVRSSGEDGAYREGGGLFMSKLARPMCLSASMENRGAVRPASHSTACCSRCSTRRHLPRVPGPHSQALTRPPRN
jgi:hypothetical protein